MSVNKSAPDCRKLRQATAAPPRGDPPATLMGSSCATSSMRKSRAQRPTPGTSHTQPGTCRPRRWRPIEAGSQMNRRLRRAAPATTTGGRMSSPAEINADLTPTLCSWFPHARRPTCASHRPSAPRARLGKTPSAPVRQAIPRRIRQSAPQRDLWVPQDAIYAHVPEALVRSASVGVLSAGRFRCVPGDSGLPRSFAVTVRNWPGIKSRLRPHGQALTCDFTL